MLFKFLAFHIYLSCIEKNLIVWFYTSVQVSNIFLIKKDKILGYCLFRKELGFNNSGAQLLHSIYDITRHLLVFVADQTGISMTRDGGHMPNCNCI